MVYAYGGIPLLYMGDELGLPNDPAWADDPLHAADNRWMHRPPMDWAAAERRTTRTTVEGRLFTAFQEMAATRASLLALRSGTVTQLVDTGNPHVLAYARRHPRGVTFLGLANFSDSPSEVGDDSLARCSRRPPGAAARLRRCTPHRSRHLAARLGLGLARRPLTAVAAMRVTPGSRTIDRRRGYAGYAWLADH